MYSNWEEGNLGIMWLELIRIWNEVIGTTIIYDIKEQSSLIIV